MEYPTEPRRIVQIAISSKDKIYAVADDDTLWERDMARAPPLSKWYLVTPLPERLTKVKPKS